MKEYGAADIKKFIEAAEDHMRRVDPSWMTRKPFESIFNSPANIFRVGALLHIGKVGFHKVLDFGAGACWLSALLNRMNVMTVSLDVSQTALDVGKRFIETNPGQIPQIATFMKYDGHTLPLDDASVDRLLAFDSFHHIPNPNRVLAEIYRVLRPGGIFAMSEPGIDHSKSDEAKREARDFGTLEQDIKIDELVSKSKAMGFTAANVSVFTMPMAGEMTYDEYRSFMGYNDAAIAGKVKGFAKYHTVLALHKGETVLDSRLPGKLLAEIKTIAAPKTAKTGERMTYRFRVTNNGDTTWLMHSDHLGVVRIGAHLYKSDGAMVEWDYGRGVAASDVKAGETAEFPIELVAPSPGKWKLVFDMVDEGVTWFFERPGNKECEIGLDVL